MTPDANKKTAELKKRAPPKKKKKIENFENFEKINAKF